MAPPSLNNLHSYHFCFLLLVSTSTISAALTASSYSSLCPSLKHASDSHTEDDDVLSLTRSFQISAGYFSGGADSLFSTGDDPYNRIYRSFSIFPHGASRTSDPALAHLTATLTIKGPHGEPYQGDRRSHNYHYDNYTIGRFRSRSRSISFFLDGYYSSASLQLCMVGTGTELAADGSLKLYKDIALRLHVPSPPTLTDPFVTGTLEGHADLGIIHLLAYAEGDDYKYGSEGVACGTPKQQTRGSLQALGSINSTWCAHLKEHLVTSYMLQEQSGAALLRRMHVNQVRCNTDGTVRAYVGFSNDTGPERRGYYYRRGRFVVDEEAVVAEGRWDRDRGVLCLRACRVVRSPSTPSLLAVREHECGIGMSFWFPAVWTMRSRSLVAGMLWNSTGNNDDDAALISGMITTLSIDGSDNHRSSNLSDVKYSYNDTMLEEARKHYRLKIETEKIKESHSFPGNYTYRDFVFDFYQQQGDGHGQAFPVTLGSAMVSGDRLAADNSFSQLVEAEQDPLLSVSYDIHHHAPPDNWVRPGNVLNYSVDLQERRILAEGVYDPKRGLLFMIGCRERNGSTDCQILVTVQFASLEARGGHGKGVFSSLREKTDPLFFEKIDITLYWMYSDQVSAEISRMDLESIMLVASATLSCVFAVLQILHTKKNPEAAAGTSITMLAILALGYLTPLVLNFEAMFKSRRSRYFAYPMGGSPEMNEAMLRAPILIAFVLQLRLLQLAWSGRQRSADQTTPSSPIVMSERIVMQICLPLYLLGGILAATFHVINAHAGSEDTQVIRVVRVGEEPATIWDWEHLVSYAGLILDGFLLPQVILNASLAASRVRALSPWFYIGCTMTRVMPHVYDVVRARIYEQSINPSDIYASPRSDLFGVAWDIIIPCGAALLAVLVFLQQRLAGAASLPSQRRRSGGYELVATL